MVISVKKDVIWTSLVGTFNLDEPKLKFIESIDIITRSSESDVRSNVTDSLECPDKFRVP